MSKNVDESKGSHRGSHKGENSGSITQLLATLNPGTRVEDVFINGKEESVKSFSSFNAGLATFVKNNGDVLVVAANRIDAIEF